LLNIVINGSGDFVIKNGVIKTSSGEKFILKENGDNLILSSGSSRGISISGSGNIIISGSGSITINGNKIDLDSKQDKNAIESFSLNDRIISTAKIKGSGSLSIVGSKNIASTLILSIAGSGEIDCVDINDFDSVIASIAGSGDISFYNVKGKALLASISGSGDILNKFNTSKFISVSSTVAGSGNIDNF